MAPQTPQTPINPQIYAEAADWLVKNRDSELEKGAKRTFDLWLRVSPEHIRAYLELSAVWEDLGLLDPHVNAASSELIARARMEENVVPMEAWTAASRAPSYSTTEEATTRRSATVRRPSPRFAIAASLLVGFALTVVFTWTNLDPSYSTDIGEQRTLTLADGSTVELNSASRIRLHFNRQHRSIELVRGQALFHVAKDPTRPFVVSAGEARVRAVGTQFDVYQKRAGIVVTVLEGQVAIIAQPVHPKATAAPAILSSEASLEPSHRGAEDDLHADPASPILLSAGQQLTLIHDKVNETRRADLAAATAWTQHRIVFTDSPLTEVVEEFNRYNTRRLIITDPHLKDFRINGVFSSADPSVLLRFLENQSDIVINDTDTTIRISRR